MAASKAAPLLYGHAHTFLGLLLMGHLEEDVSPDALSSGFRECFGCLFLQMSHIAHVIMSHIRQNNFSYLPPKKPW